MGRSRLVRSVKVCKVCGEGYDAFKAWDARGRYCSPACLAEARRRQREHDAADLAEPVIGPAALPPVISLGNLRSVVALGPEASAEGEPRRLL